MSGLSGRAESSRLKRVAGLGHSTRALDCLRAIGALGAIGIDALLLCVLQPLRFLHVSNVSAPHLRQLGVR